MDHHAAPGAQSYRNADLIITSLNLPQTQTLGVHSASLWQTKVNNQQNYICTSEQNVREATWNPALRKAGVSRRRPE